MASTQRFRLSLATRRTKALSSLSLRQILLPQLMCRLISPPSSLTKQPKARSMSSSEHIRLPPKMAHHSARDCSTTYTLNSNGSLLFLVTLLSLLRVACSLTSLIPSTLPYLHGHISQPTTTVRPYSVRSTPRISCRFSMAYYRTAQQRQFEDITTRLYII